MMYKLTHILVLLAACSASALQAETISDAALGFTLELPSGFNARPDLLGMKPTVAHAFEYQQPGAGRIATLLLIERMGGTIGREHLRPEQMPAGFNGKLFLTKWRDFDVDGFEVPEEVNGTKTVTYNVQIPLKAAAVQVTLFGPADRREQLDSLLRSVLDALHGQSNWLTSVAPGAIANNDKYGMILLLYAVSGIFAGLVVLWFVSRRAPKGTVFAIAVAIYVASWSFDQVQVREAMVLRGSMRMLGFAGAILGVVDLWRRRGDKPSNAPDVPSQ